MGNCNSSLAIKNKLHYKATELLFCTSLISKKIAETDFKNDFYENDL